MRMSREKNLFSKDRNSKCGHEQKPVEEKKMPALPILYGVMGIALGRAGSDRGRKGEPGHAVRAGDTVGEFKVLALDTQNITFGWNGKEVSKKIEELIDRETPGGGSAGPAAPAAVPSGPAAPPPPPANNSPLAESMAPSR